MRGTESLAGARGVLAFSFFLKAGRRPARTIMSGCQDSPLVGATPGVLHSDKKRYSGLLVATGDSPIPSLDTDVVATGDSPIPCLDADFPAAGGKVRIQTQNPRELPKAVRSHKKRRPE